MAATEIKQIVPSTMDTEDQVEPIEGLNRDGEVERWKLYPFMNSSNQDMEGPKGQLPEWSKAESRPEHDKIEN